MFVLFASKSTGRIYKWKAGILEQNSENFKEIEFGTPITIEYKKIKLVSENFDCFGKSQIMVTNTIKTEHSSDYLVDNIVYYNKDVIPIKINNTKKSCHIINSFNHNKFSSDVCYYNPGFLPSNTITITTKFWEIDDPSFVTKVVNYMKQLLSYTTVVPTPVTPYINIADTVLGSAGKLVTSLINNKELAKEQTIEFSGSNNKPIIPGYYICLPNIVDINIVNNLIESYYLDDNTLVTKNETSAITEFNDSYFIMEISNNEREYLHDYDFITRSNNLLNNIIKTENNVEGIYQSVIDHKDKLEDDASIKEFIRINKEYEDFKNIKRIEQMLHASLFNKDTTISQSQIIAIKSAYNHLSYDNKQWFNSVFPNYYEKIK